MHGVAEAFVASDGEALAVAEDDGFRAGERGSGGAEENCGAEHTQVEPDAG